MPRISCNTPIRALTAALALAFATPALGHPSLVSSSPAPSTSSTHVDQIVLTFSEPLVASFSGFDIVHVAIPVGESHGHVHRPTQVPGLLVSVGRDGKSLVARPSKPLAKGTYEVNWRAVGADGHRVTGKVTFIVQ